MRLSCVTNEPKRKKTQKLPNMHTQTHRRTRTVNTHRQQTFETMLVKLNDFVWKGSERNSIRFVLKTENGSKQKENERNMVKIGGANGVVPENSCNTRLVVATCHVNYMA